MWFNLPTVFHKPRVQDFDEARWKKKRKTGASKSRNANCYRRKSSTCRARETVSLYVSFKKKFHRWKKIWKVSKPEMPLVTGAIWKQFRDVESAWNCKPKRNLMSSGGKERRQVVVKPLLHQMLLVSWLLTLFQRPDNSPVIYDTDEPGPSVQCSMPSTSLSQGRKREKKKGWKCPLSCKRICNF